MLKISKKISIIVFIVLIFVIIVSNAYNFIYEALEFKEVDENKARENLNALIKWSENEGKEELEFAKNLSKETYNQERVTQMIIKNFEKIKVGIESMRTLTIYSITDEDNEFMIKADVTIRSNVDTILYLLDREKTFIGQKTYLLFDEKRFKAYENFLFFLNTHLEKDALQKDIKRNIFSDIIPYINTLFGTFLAFSYLYTSEILENFTCEFNNPKTIAILNRRDKFDETASMVMEMMDKDFFIDEKSKQLVRQKFNKVLEILHDSLVEIQSIQTKLKECK